MALKDGQTNVRLIAARHAPVYNATSGRLHVPRSGRYTAWLEGSTRGDDGLWVDGAKVGEARQQIENEGRFIELGTVWVSAGAHHAKLRFGGADLYPGSGGFPRPEVGPLLFVPAGKETDGLVSVSLKESNRLCGKPWDWIEVAG